MEFSRENLKQRVKELKAFLPHNVRNQIFEMHPEYNTKEGKNLVYNVLKLRSTDYRLMEILEKIVSKNQQ